MKFILLYFSTLYTIVLGTEELTVKHDTLPLLEKMTNNYL